MPEDGQSPGASSWRNAVQLALILPWALGGYLLFFKGMRVGWFILAAATLAGMVIELQGWTRRRRAAEADHDG